MRTIRELNPSEKQQIEEALKADQFESVLVSNDHIRFKKQYRTFELVSTDLSQEDMGIRIDFDQDFLFSKESKSESLKYSDLITKNKHKDKLKKYQEKTRTSVSFTNRQDLYLDDEEAIDSIPGWKVVEMYSIALDSNWIAEIHSPTIYHIQINGKDHSIINDKVYEGKPDIYISMGKIDIFKFFENTQFLNVLNSLNKH